MKTFMMVAIATALVSFGLIKATGGSGHSFSPGDATDGTLTQNNQVRNRTMRAFRSERELASYFRELAEKQKRERQRMSVYSALSTPPAPMAKLSAGLAADSRSAANEDSVTNVQEAGVDEGGIVKLHGNHLVVLRRGRLFTVAIGDGALDPVSSVDAFAPDIDPRSTWYDEMLVSDDTIAVIGYSYERGGTEVGLFHIDPAGNLTYGSTYHLRSNDYYSSRNYASRLIGTKLIFYSPLYFYPGAEEPLQSLPAVRKWTRAQPTASFGALFLRATFTGRNMSSIRCTARPCIP
jgi:hypothetical protein